MHMIIPNLPQPILQLGMVLVLPTPEGLVFVQLLGQGLYMYPGVARSLGGRGAITQETAVLPAPARQALALALVLVLVLALALALVLGHWRLEAWVTALFLLCRACPHSSPQLP